MDHPRSLRPRRLAPGLMGLAALVSWLVAPAAARAQVGPEESARKLKPAAGLEATLWASEPMVVNPTNIDIDSRGRLWVSEGLNYRLTQGTKSFKRIEDADKIKILEDTDGDGKADKVTVFADKIYPIPMGLAVEERYGKDGKYQGCKVYVGNSPDLLVLEDTDGDDKADKRYPLLTGFGGVDSDHGVHGMTLGLDGKLYFTHGDGCCSFEQSDGSHNAKNFDVVDKSGRRVHSDQLANTLRVNRDGTQFEILADRQRNNYEAALNSFGNVFVSDNDDDGNRGSRVIWVMEGGKYGYRTPGSPRHWGEDVPGNVPKLVGTGNGSPCGITAYEGDLLPEEYRGGLLEADAGTRQIDFFPLNRKGAAFRTDYKVFLASDDPWFRPVDMTAAPDGSVFVADWYDAGVGGHAFSDQTTGRIYRVAPKGSKRKVVKADFATVPGLIAALKSPVIATQDAARRALIACEDDPNVLPAVGEMFSSAKEGVHRARALWVLAAIEKSFPYAFVVPLNKDLAQADPRLREQAVRIIGRHGKVEATGNAPMALPPGAGLARLHVENDPDAGVRRELILALRDVPTDQAGSTLKTLVRSWDGQDRWYLEALGLALEKRESDFLAGLFDGSTFGDLDLDHSGKNGQVALPPYFPVDRNEAYIPTGAKDLPANALSKTLGLAWRIHRAEVLPLLAKLIPRLDAPDLREAADDILGQMRDPETAVVLADLASRTDDPARKRQLLTVLAERLDEDWKPVAQRREIVALIESALGDRETRLEGVELAAATDDRRYTKTLIALARDANAGDELRANAVEAVAGLGDPETQAFLVGMVESARDQKIAPATALAAVRSLNRLDGARERVTRLVGDSAYPASLRRQALRTLARLPGGVEMIVSLAKKNEVAPELRTEAAMILNSHPDRSIRQQAAGLIPLAHSRNGQPLPSFFELVRREGKAEKGREVFFRTAENACGGCHRVQGRGNWVGPDLSTIGTKYGRDELVRSILNPSAAIGYNFRSLVIALDDGRVLTGLPVEDTADRLVLKTADGQRVAIKPSHVEERKSSDVSLMPEGLAETMTNDEIIDLLTFLSTLKEPVSIVGQYHVIGPVAEAGGTRALDTSRRVDLRESLRGSRGQKLSWRRLDANAESLADVSTIVGDDSTNSAYLFAPVVSPLAQPARLVIDTKAGVTAWLNGKSLDLPAPGSDGTRSLSVELPEGASDLLLRVGGGPNVAVVTTLVTARPVAFQAEGVRSAAR